MDEEKQKIEQKAKQYSTASGRSASSSREGEGKESFMRIFEEEYNYATEIQKLKKELERTNRIVFYALLIAVITLSGATGVFIVGFSEMTRDNINEKETLINYNFKIDTLKGKINQQQIQINDFEAEISRLGSESKKEIELLRAKNPYLK